MTKASSLPKKTHYLLEKRDIKIIIIHYDMAVIDIIDIYIYNRQFQAIKGSLRKSYQLCFAER